jgi:hypothetical protein
MMPVLPILQVILVAHQDNNKPLICVILCLFDPFAQIIVGLAICNIVHQDGPDRTSIV